MDLYWKKKNVEKMFATYIFSHIGNITDHIWKNSLVPNLSVLLNDNRDNIEHISPSNFLS